MQEVVKEKVIFCCKLRSAEPMSEYYSNETEEEKRDNITGNRHRKKPALMLLEGRKKNSEQMPDQLTKAGITFLTINIETAYHAEQ